MLTRVNSRCESNSFQTSLKKIAFLILLACAGFSFQLNAQTIVIEDLVMRTVGVDELGAIAPNSNLDLKAYPIPSTSPLTIQTISGSRILAVKIMPKFLHVAYNGNANISYTKSAQHKVTLNISNLPKGVYVARVYTDMGYMQVNIVR